MRKTLERQLRLKQTTIENVDLALESRHEMVPILAGLQYLYQNKKHRDEVLEMIQKDVVGQSSPHHGRKGMDCWEILVLAAVRKGCNLDYVEWLP